MSWQSVFTTPVSALYMKDDNTGFVTSGYSIYKTKNGGVTWELSYSDSLVNFRAIDGRGDIVIAVGKQPGTDGLPDSLGYVIRTSTLGE